MIQEDDLMEGTAQDKVLKKVDCSKWMGVSRPRLGKQRQKPPGFFSVCQSAYNSQLMGVCRIMASELS
jgi:hypothetical protein